MTSTVKDWRWVDVPDAKQDSPKGKPAWFVLMPKRYAENKTLARRMVPKHTRWTLAFFAMGDKFETVEIGDSILFIGYLPEPWQVPQEAQIHG